MQEVSDGGFHPTDVTVQALERLRLLLSTYQDGTGQNDGGNSPGWRDFERAVALTFNGVASESKAIFDVLVPHPDQKGVKCGISCKMRATLSDLQRTGRITVEVSNSAKKFGSVPQLP